MRRILERVHVSRRQYSTARLFGFRDYCNSVSQLRVALVLSLYCSPALAIIITLDLVPLQDPSNGWRANWTYWARLAVGASVIALMLLAQVQFAIPEVSFTRAQVVAVSLGTGGGYVAAIMLLAQVWRFPVPFAFTVGCVPMTLVHNALVVVTLGTADKARLDKYLRFSNSVGIQGTMLLVYPLYNALFVSLEGVPQLALVLLLPVIKHTFKYLSRRTHFAGDDLITASQTSVDFFDALYMTKCMQSGTTLAVGCAIIVVDTAQNYAAILNLTKQTRTLVTVKNKTSSVRDPSSSSSAAAAAACENKQLLPWVLGLLGQMGRSTSTALDCVSTRRPTTKLKQTLDRIQEKFKTSSASKTHSYSMNAVVPAPQSHIVNADATQDPTTTPATAVSTPGVPTHEMAVTETLRLLHLSESIIVVEYIETVAPTMYALYTAVLFQLPNAQYYQDTQSLTRERFHSAELNILAYAFMELLSMVYVHAMLKRHFDFSVLDQLAFTLERDWPVIQCCLVTWSMIVFQYLLVHNGVDYGFILGG